MLEKTLESPLDSKEIKPVNPKGNQPWLFIGRTDVEAEAPIFQPPDAKCQLLGKDPDAGKDWGLEKKGMTEDEMVGWHHQLSGHDFEQTWEIVKIREFWHASVCGVTKRQTQLSDWRINNKVKKVVPRSDLISFLIRKTPETLNSFSLSLSAKVVMWIYSPNGSYLEARKRLLLGAELTGTLILDSPASGLGRNICLLFKLSNLWHFVMAMWAGCDTL